MTSSIANDYLQEVIGKFTWNKIESILYRS